MCAHAWQHMLYVCACTSLSWPQYWHRTREMSVCIDVVHVPKDLITDLGKQGDSLEEMELLFENFDRWGWWGFRGSPSAVRPLSSSAPFESGHWQMQVHAPPPSPVSSIESDLEHDPPPSLTFLSEPYYEPNDSELPQGPEPSSDICILYHQTRNRQQSLNITLVYGAIEPSVGLRLGHDTSWFPAIGMQSTIPNMLCVTCASARTSECACACACA
jgi:hypothetical protein